MDLHTQFAEFKKKQEFLKLRKKFIKLGVVAAAHIVGRGIYGARAVEFLDKYKVKVRHWDMMAHIRIFDELTEDKRDIVISEADQNLLHAAKAFADMQCPAGARVLTDKQLLEIKSWLTNEGMSFESASARVKKMWGLKIHALTLHSMLNECSDFFRGDINNFVIESVTAGERYADMSRFLGLHGIDISQQKLRHHYSKYAAQ